MMDETNNLLREYQKEKKKKKQEKEMKECFDVFYSIKQCFGYQEKKKLKQRKN